MWCRRGCFGLGVVLVGDVAEKYGEVHDLGVIGCDVGYTGCKREGDRRQQAGGSGQIAAKDI
jgi:hypothetical protein